MMYFGYLLCVTKENLQNHIPKGIWDEMHECYAMQILETKKTKTKEQWSQKVEQ